ncbi:MAG: hypothetical protein ABL995_12900 [Bryobacteraceae bacterium]
MVSFRYEMAGYGWADAFLSDGTKTVEIPASYICDSLGDLTKAVVTLFSEDRSGCGWLEEPGFAAWTFIRNGQDLLIRVDWFNDWPDDSTDLRSLGPDIGTGREMFSAQTDFLSFVKQLDQSLQKILDTLGADGYEKDWDHPYPLEAHVRLRQELSAHLV